MLIRPLFLTTPLPALAPKAYDPTTVSDEELKTLSSSKSPQDQMLATTLKNARHAYAAYIAEGAKVSVTTSPGNGGYPVLTLMGPGFDPNKPASVQTHYHGWSSTVTERLGDSGRVQLRLREVQKADPQTVFVMPECKSAVYGALPSKQSPSVSEQSPGYKTDWSNVTSETITTNHALLAAGIGKVKERVVSAHSGGGAALEYAMQNGMATGNAAVQADRLELLDCFYGSEVTIGKWAATTEGAAVKDVAYVHGTNDHSTKPVEDAFGSRYHRLDVKAQKGNPLATDSNGKPLKVFGQPLTRLAWGTNVHVRANTEFMHMPPPAAAPLAALKMPK